MRRLSDGFVWVLVSEADEEPEPELDEIAFQAVLREREPKLHPGA